MAIVPGLLLLARRERSVLLWALASPFLISWLADWPAHFIHQSSVTLSVVYPLTQAAVLFAVLLPRGTAVVIFALLTMLAIAAVTAEGVGRPEYLFRAVAWGLVIAVLLEARGLGPYRSALVVYFGAGLLTWIAYCAAPSWPSWGAYQLARFAGISMFCWAVWPRKATVAT
jgi:hypothetical protein